MDKKQSISTRDGKNTSNGSELFFEGMLDTIRESLLILDAKCRVTSANKTFYKVFRVTPQETIGKKIYQLGNGQWNIPSLKKLLEEILPQHNPFNNYRVEHTFPKIGKKVMLLNARQIKQGMKWKEQILLAIEDVTERDITEENQIFHSALIKNVADAVIMIDENFAIKSWNKAAEELYGWNEKEVIGKDAKKFLGTRFPSFEKPPKLKDTLKKGYWKGEVIQKKKKR